jgi:hypothetical protein
MMMEPKISETLGFISTSTWLIAVEDLVNVCINHANIIHIFSHFTTDLINALPGISSINMVQHATIYEAVFCMSSTPSSGGTTGLCNPFLINGSTNTFPRIRPCYESGDVINRDGVLRGVCAECL